MFGPVVVVSGLPRSGTSLMMQMLAAGGLPVLTDHVRGADEDNPKGYFEFSQVKSLARDNTWLASARGRAVKVIAPLLVHLDPDLDYRILFMERNMDEILASQKNMLLRSGKSAPPEDDLVLARVFEAQLNEIKIFLSENAWPVLFVPHQDVILHPVEIAARVNAFLGGALNLAAMGQAVEPALHRQKRRPKQRKNGM